MAGVAFDALAPKYDELVEANPLHSLMRRSSVAWLDEAFAPGMRVLEIGCGLGTEAIHLAKRRVIVVATDASGAMVKGAASRAKAAGLGDMIQVRQVPASQLSDSLHGELFDGAYASFGALNCEDDLDGTVAGIAGLLRPGVPFLTSVVNRPCVWEIGAGLLTLRPGKGFRRLREDGMSVDLYGTSKVWSRAYSESEIRRAVKPWFDVERVEGWLVALPPPYLSEQWRRLQFLHRPLQRADRILAGSRLFRGLGDHLHLWVRRNSR